MHAPMYIYIDELQAAGTPPAMGEAIIPKLSPKPLQGQAACQVSKLCFQSDAMYGKDEFWSPGLKKSINQAGL